MNDRKKSSISLNNFITRILVALIVFFKLILASTIIDNLPKSHLKRASGNDTKTPNLVLANKQAAPKFTYVVWDDNGMVCILAKFEATLTISYDTPSGEHKLMEKMPVDVKFKGRCDYLLDEKPVLDVSWIGGFTFRMIFEKYEENRWGVNSIELLYNTADSLFQGSIHGGKKLARSKTDLGMFSTPLGKSYYCPSPPIIHLYETKTGKQVAVIRFNNVHLQAFQSSGKFAPISRCSQVSFGSGVPAPLYVSLEQDDSVPLVVGTLTVIVSILVIVGYAVYKSWVFKQVNYDNMI